MVTLGIEPKTNGLLDQRSTNWATRPDNCNPYDVGWFLDRRIDPKKSFLLVTLQYKTIWTRLEHLLGCVAALCDPSGDKG